MNPISNGIIIHFISISDFDFASFEDEHVELCMLNAFASSNFLAKKPTHQIDDLESLVFTLWYVARLPGNETEGKVLHSTLM